MANLETEYALLIAGVLLLTTVLAGSLSSRFGLPALIGFLGLGMLAGVEGPGGIGFSNFSVAQSVGTVSLIFILFSGGMDTAWADVGGSQHRPCCLPPSACSPAQVSSQARRCC